MIARSSFAKPENQRTRIDAAGSPSTYSIRWLAL